MTSEQPSTDGDESNDEDPGVTRRTFVQAAGLVAAAAPLGLGAGEAAATDGFDGRFRNWRAREAQHAWDRGYRGRPDRTLALTDTGQDVRHPDLGPWNGVTAFVEDGELKLTKPEENDVSRVETGNESFSGTMGPGTFATGEEKYHEFTAPEDVDELDAELSWSPNADASNDLEFRLDEYVDGQWETVARAATASMPEKLSAPVESGRKYRFAIEAYVNTTTNYEISGTYYEISGTVETYDDSVVFEGTDGEPTPDTPKAVGWYDPGSSYGYRKKPRDPNGHGSHCSSIMAGTSRASAVEPASVQEDAPRTVLSEVTNGTLSYEVEAEAGTGVFGSAYGELIELRVEGPDGRTLDSSTVGVDDSSTWDNNVVEAPAEQTGTYTVYVQTLDGEKATSAYVETVSVAAFRDPQDTVGERADASDTGFHAGLAPDQSIACLQGLSAPTEDLGRLADQFADTFNLRTVNMSWGYVGGLPLGAAAGTLDRIPGVIKDIAQGGILTCAAAGNAATPVNGNGSPAVADEAISVAATGPLDGISGYSSGGIGAVDEDEGGAYMKPDLTAPGGTVTDLVNAVKAGRADTPEDEQPAIRDYTGMAGTSMASPYTTGVSGLVAQAMEEDAPSAISLPAPTETGFGDVMRLKQTLLATATETVFTAAPYHRAKTPTYDFGGRDPYEGFGRVNPGPAVDAATRELSLGSTTSEVVGLRVPDDERAAAGHLDVDPGTYEVSASFSHLSGGDKGSAEGNPHVDLFVYDAENPAQNGEPNVVARAQGLEGSPTATFTTDSGGVYYVVAKLVDVPGVVNGDDVQVHFDLSTATVQGFVAAGARSDDGDVFTGGQTNQIDISAEASEAVEVRDVVPYEWDVLEEYSDDVNHVERDPFDGKKYVYFNKDAATASVDATYFVEAPDSADLSNAYAFGPVQVSPDGGETWVQLSGTSDTNVVAGTDTEL